MKQIQTMAVVCLLTMSMFFLGGCSKNDSIQNSSVVTMESFSSLGKLYSKEQADALIAKKELANTPEKALVMIFFKQDGMKYTAEEYEELFPKLLSGEIPELPTYFTDLATFYSVTKQPTALPDYAQVIGDNYVYDNLRKVHRTRDEEEKLINEKLLKSNQTSSLAAPNWAGYLKNANVGTCMYCL
jgi:hypothetical protein